MEIERKKKTSSVARLRNFREAAIASRGPLILLEGVAELVLEAPLVLAVEAKSACGKLSRVWQV